ncbi:hypothetical protein D3C83_270440 [compost metagenome]
MASASPSTSAAFAVIDSALAPSVENERTPASLIDAEAKPELFTPVTKSSNVSPAAMV